MSGKRYPEEFKIEAVKQVVVRVMDRATGVLFLCFAAKLAISTR